MKTVILLSGNRPHAGKDTFVDEFIKQFDLSEANHLKVSLPLKTLAEAAFTDLTDYISETFGLQTIPENWYEKKNAITRRVLQGLGGKVLDTINPDYLIDDTIKQINESTEELFIISDWRKQIEFDKLALGDCKLITIRIVRPGDDVDNNSTADIEQGLNGFLFDHIIHNDSDFETYQDTVSEFIEWMLT